MQILLAAHSTLIKIHDSRKKFQHILHFIDQHFEIDNSYSDCIYLPASSDNSVKRVFLLKWLYSYYSNKYATPVPGFKEVLLARAQKPIQIHLPPLQAETLDLTITFYTEGVFQILLSKFTQPVDNFLRTHFSPFITFTDKNLALYEMCIDSKNIRKEFDYLLSQTELDGCQLNFIYNRQAYERFTYVYKPNSLLLDACKLLGVNIDTPLKVVKRNYRKLAQRYHPDTASNLSINVCREKFQGLMDALELIKSQQV